MNSVNALFVMTTHSSKNFFKKQSSIGLKKTQLLTYSCRNCKCQKEKKRKFV